MKERGPLAAWMWRRNRARWRFQRRLVSLFVDWVTGIYVIAPVVLLVGWLLIRYYRGAWVHTLQTTPAMRLPAVTIFGALVCFVLFVLHSLCYGTVPIPLEAGDRLFLLLSPFSRRFIAAALWTETWVLTLPWAGGAWLATYPLARACGVTALAWTIWMLGWAVYEASVRLLSQLFNPRESRSWRRRAGFHAGRYLSYLALALSARATLGYQSESVAAVWAGCTLLMALCAIRLSARLDWDPLFQSRTNPLWTRWLPDDEDHPRQVLYHRRRPAAWAARMLDWLCRGQLHPLAWLVVVRGLRRRGTLRDLAYLTFAFIGTVRLAPPFARYVCAAFFGFMLYQWWDIAIAPLYRSPVRQQTVVEEWRMKGVAMRCRVGLVAGMTAFWLLLQAVLGR